MTLGRRSCIHCLSSLISLTFLVQLLQAQSDIFSTLSHANELSSKGDYGEALRILEPLVQSKTVEPAETGRVWIQLGSVYQDLGRYPEAQRAYQTAISLFKNRPGREREERVALDDLGSLYLDLGQAEMSRRLRLQVLKSAAATEDHAAVARAYNNLSAASIQQRDWKEARKWLANAQAEVKLMPKVRADDLAAIHCNAGWLSEHDHDYEQALKYYEAALDAHLAPAKKSTGARQTSDPWRIVGTGSYFRKAAFTRIRLAGTAACHCWRNIAISLIDFGRTDGASLCNRLITSTIRERLRRSLPLCRLPSTNQATSSKPVSGQLPVCRPTGRN